MSDATESSTTINAGVGGDAVRDFVVTKPDGSLIKIQAVSVVDPYDLANVQSVNHSGEAAISDEIAIELLTRISERLDNILELLLGTLGP